MLEVSPSPANRSDAEQAVRVAEEGTLNPSSWGSRALYQDPYLWHWAPSQCWRLCWEGQAEEQFSWKG